MSHRPRPAARYASMNRLVIASRQSRLALWQAQHVRARLSDMYPSCRVEILGLTTQGDRRLDIALAAIGGKGLFVRELETALQDGRADIAVHSAKDVPMELPPGLCLAALSAREDARDALVSPRYESLEALPEGARLGSSSLRREAQIRAQHPRIRVLAARGNLDTRLAKLERGEYDALVLAAAGLRRLGLGERIRCLLEPEVSLPAPGQGALAIECRTDRADLLAALAPLDDPATAACVRAERALSASLSGSCRLPLGAFAVERDAHIHLRGVVGMPDGSRLIHAESSGPRDAPQALGRRVAEALRARGAQDILDALAGGAA
ncbi:MAG: hydroxymethylbilane synthase [Burkholderiales bacterium]|nr:hydroxymethylbilane synthase [Burkholderiales bacterium]